MANINFFYPQAKQGVALGLNAAGGNIGVAVRPARHAVRHRRRRAVRPGRGEQRRHPPGAGRLSLCRARGPRRGLALLLHGQPVLRQVRAEGHSSQVVRQEQTWIMSVLYIGTFGSFIGYSAAMPLLIKINFYADAGAAGHRHQLRLLRVPRRARRLADPAVRRLAGGQVGGARVTLCTFAAMIAGTLRCCGRCAADPEPHAGPGHRARQRVVFPWFLVAFLFVFAATGIGNGSTYRMIPVIWQRRRADRHSGTPRTRPRRRSPAPGRPRRSSASLGGRRLRRLPDPAGLRRPWIDDPVERCRTRSRRSRQLLRRSAWP